MYNINTIIDEILIDSLMNLGKKHQEEKAYALSEQSYQKALELSVKISNLNPNKHRGLLLNALKAIAQLHTQQKSYEIAVEYYREVITIGDILFNETQSVEYALLLAHTYTIIGDLNRDYHTRKMAKHFYAEALKNYNFLEKKGAYAYYEIPILHLYLNMVKLYEEESMFGHTEKYYKKAISRCERLIERGLNSYKKELAKLHCDLGSTYFFQANFEKAKAHYVHSLEISTQLTKKISESYIETIAIAQNNLASIYSTEKNFDKALDYYKQALPHLSSLADSNPAKYGHNVAILFRNLASIYFQKGNNKKAEFFHLKSLGIFKEFSEYNSEKYNMELAASIIDGVEFYNQHSLSLYKAENILKKYQLKTEATMLLSRITALRKQKIKEGV